ncbi:hypothetical protein F444_20455 [Phytophthora nicotianae P1976]|uniref:Uncharacterized protein n=1 Tax=Phytophthora nicotianae P1976 TaxID=1317066 RepID=A0A080Z4J1_PHYNI|nr:hypothetical protein F444_20455 [Phytophthora nicotianae P1976]
MVEPRGAVSLAQVEQELLSAEAYLTASQALPPPSVAFEAFKDEESGLKHEDSNFRRKLKARPILSEERRREILAKLSSERQTALRTRHVDTVAGDEMGYQVTASEKRTYRTPEERHELIHKLLSERDTEFKADSGTDFHFGEASVHPIDVRRGDELSGEFQHEAIASRIPPSTVSDDNDEIYYASDILDNTTAADIQPRSKLDFLFEGEEALQTSDPGYSPEISLSQTEFSHMVPNKKTEVDEPVPSSLFAKLLRQEHETEAQTQANAEIIPKSFVDHHDYADVPWVPTDEHQEEQFVHSQDIPHIDQRRATTNRPTSRIEFLAQPRNQTFAEREKQRLLLEMEQLRECTFHPNVLKPPRSISKAKNKDQGRPGTTDFQWLTLSPRQKIFRRIDDSNDKENGSQNVIQRLHLDGTVRYELREQARQALEAQQLQECTFIPKINPTSKSMFSMVDYKPIHHRVPDLQRAKAEYIERIREQLDKEECGPLSFTPTINPKSREIATNRLAEREAELQDAKHLKVTDRLANDADEIAERKLATQEYFDMLNEQPFAPQISETSRKIVEQKPEFKMNFVARQEYFQYRDQEKMEALEGFCEMEDTRGEKLTFKPDIGNADGVLKHLRPDRCSESSQQKLYRLTYNDQREAELKKQRLREEQYAQYTFKPEINPVSKALGRSSTLDELSHPVIDIQPDPPGSKCSPPQERRNGNDISTRVALRSYFANKRFRSRVALEMEEASKAECTFQPTLVASKQRDGCASTSKLHNREPRSRTKLEWQSENLLHLIEAERQKKADEIEAKRNAQELKELEECTFKPNLHKPRTRGKPSANGSPSPPRGTVAEEKPVIVRGLGRFLELRDRARQQQAEQKQREQKVFAPNTSYEPRSYTVPKPFKLSETSKESIRRRLKVREEMRAKERQECTFRPQTISSQNRRVLQNLLNN